MFHQLFLSFAWVFGCAAGGILVDTCCAQKRVGGVSYTLVEKGFDTAAYGCISNCMYEKDDQPGSRFCFAYGDMEVVCGDEKESRGGDPICDEELERLFNYIDRSGPLKFRCCHEENRGEYHNCTDLASCSKICGGNVSCIKPVSSLDYLDQCDIDKNAGNPNRKTALVEAGEPYCESTLECPTSNADPNIACCQYPDVYNCQSQCRCKGTCAYFIRYSICSPRVSGCCGCDGFDCGSPTCSPDSPTLEPEPSSAGLEPATLSSEEDCSGVAEDCTSCGNFEYPICEKECRCHCTCQAIIKCTGVDAIFPWNQCWADYAGCCACDGADLKYKDYCPTLCQVDNIDTSAPPFKSPVAGQRQIVADSSVCSPFSISAVSEFYVSFGSLLGSKVTFNDFEYSQNGPITKVIIYTGEYDEVENVIVGIRTTYGDITTPIRGRKGDEHICAGNFGRIGSYLACDNNGGTIITALGFADYAGTTLCGVRYFGNCSVGLPNWLQNSPPDTAGPYPPDEAVVIQHFTGYTVDGMLGKITAFFPRKH